jgi:hypothetical protein
MPARPQKPIFLLRKTYLSVIQGSVGSKMFRECHFKIGSRNIEVLENGNLACAFYVSSILKIFDLLNELHTTVNATEEDLLRSGWQDIERPRVGCVIIYAPKTHRHLGFYIGKGAGINNNASKAAPHNHEWDYRPVERLLWHAKLEM